MSFQPMRGVVFTLHIYFLFPGVEKRWQKVTIPLLSAISCNVIGMVDGFGLHKDYRARNLG